ncbi:cytochrome c family protein [Roseomonas alkaliterrae]|uniref:Cytochrome c n=1 Tax=Neoroseomonas alkaliterrae TaxID=1452450 RepID=A0A840XQJ4_9PROT|nr:cytochrome c family protein [Neoroseomonas alkaliterrae]MBB5690186.1 cytochrome c [Neoroseomonas alkaliterrae]MBR0674774.1 cytochrome c family protein [Neoroseomonas alkaliterrae]
MSLRLALALVVPLAGAAPALAADAAAGQRVFNQCRACHTVEQGGRNGVGPNLHGIFGRTAGSIEGFRYSAAMKARGEAGLVWTPETLAPYLRNPREAVPGGSMAFAGLRNEQQIADLIAYLQQATGASR